jgi:hypothetical protein
MPLFFATTSPPFLVEGSATSITPHPAPTCDFEITSGMHRPQNREIIMWPVYS